jgi:alpha-amylase
MPSVCLYFRVHIPCRLKPFPKRNVADTGSLFDMDANKPVISKLCDECYLPANKIMQELIETFQGNFKITFSISGTAIELLQQYRPDVLDSFKMIAETGCVEFLAETYYNSLSWLHSKNEFKRQVKMHHEKIVDIFGCTPVVFRNTELIYSNELADFIAEMGYKGILCEGLESILNGRTPNRLYAAPGNDNVKIILRNTSLSDDIAFRFDDAAWNEQPLTAGKFAGWVHSHDENIDSIHLFFDYESFGIYKKPETGIFDFLKSLPFSITSNKQWKFETPCAIIEQEDPKDIFDAPQIISWQNKSPDNCIWSENTMQRSSLHKIYHIENMVQNINCTNSLEYWGYLQSADYFFCMSETRRTVNDAYLDLCTFASAGEAHLHYKNMVTEFEIHLIQLGLETFRSMRRKEGSYHLYADAN